MDLKDLEEKLQKLRDELNRLETAEAEKIKQKRILADMDDDFRENEGAKLVMEDHNLLHLRTLRLKEEIIFLKRKIFLLRAKK